MTSSWGATTSDDAGMALRVRERLVAMGMSQLRFTAVAGIPKSTFNRVANGRRASPPMMFTIAEHLGVSVEWLLSGAAGAGGEPGQIVREALGRMDRASRRALMAELVARELRR